MTLEPDAGSLPTASTLSLSAIELGLIAELNLEMASAYDEVAADDAQPADTRESARHSAARRRQRAESFHLEALRLGETSATPDAETVAAAVSPYSGPERRKQERRVRERRGGHAVTPAVLGGAERRSNGDRRRRDRRHAIRAPR